jgi:hypothetical protein
MCGALHLGNFTSKYGFFVQVLFNKAKGRSNMLIQPTFGVLQLQTGT